METSLFYTTHIIMLFCVIAVVGAAYIDSRRALTVRGLSSKKSGIPFLKKLKAIYRFSEKEVNGFKAMIINVLNIGIQISTQFLK